MNARPRRSLLVAPVLALAVVAASCSTDDADQRASTTEATPAPVDDTAPAGGDDLQAVVVAPASCDEVAAAFATRGSANPELADPESSAVCEGDTIVVRANGIPDYPYVQTSPGEPEATDLELTLPAVPAMADEVTAVPQLGTAAVALDGVPIYGPTEGQGGDVLSLTGALSACGSHNGPTGFHAHLLGTSDTAECTFTPDEVAAGPQLWGYALDGYPIYSGNDQHTSSWQLTDEALFATDTWAAHSYVEGSGDLDECNGTVLDDGTYAYVTTDTFPYVLGCYRGVVDLEAALGGSATAAGPGPGPGAGGP